MPSEEMQVWIASGVAMALWLLGRLTLRGYGVGGRPGLLHFLAGVVAIGCWSVFLWGRSVVPDSWEQYIGVVGLGCWWIVAVCGLLIASSAKPPRGRYSAPVQKRNRWVPRLIHWSVLLLVGFLSYSFTFAIV